MAIPLQYVNEIGSTSEEMKQRAECGHPEQALMARRQTAGRGRLGRAWQTIDGNLHMSVLLRPGHPILPGHWSLLSAVALADTASRFAAPGMIRLKWPNDLLLGEGKAGGVLLEAALGETPWLVIGFGVNLVGAPAGLGRPVATFAGSGAPPAPDFARCLLAALNAWQERYRRDGFPPVLGRWREFGHAAGAAVIVGTGDKRVEGRFRGIGPDGSLELETCAGLVAVSSGEVE